jgi:hypothetical protein
VLSDIAQKPPGAAWAEDLKWYAIIGGASLLTIMFLPEIMASIREARKAGKPQQVTLATNRRRRRRRR